MIYKQILLNNLVTYFFSYTGWYRDCDILSYQKDVDLAMFNYDYDPKIFREFRKNTSEARVVMKLGLVREAFELRIFTVNSLTVDIFLTYKINDTYQWNGYQYERRLFQQLLLYFNESNLCSGELLGNKFIVPCNPEDYLSFQYGEKKWKQPLFEKYFNLKSIKHMKNWSDSLWPYVQRHYDFNNGELLTQLTLKRINEFAKPQISSIPDDLF